MYIFMKFIYSTNNLYLVYRREISLDISIKSYLGTRIPFIYSTNNLYLVYRREISLDISIKSYLGTRIPYVQGPSQNSALQPPL